MISSSRSKSSSSSRNSSSSSSSSTSSSSSSSSPLVKKFINHTRIMKFLPKWVLQYPEIQLCYSWLC